VVVHLSLVWGSSGISYITNIACISACQYTKPRILLTVDKDLLERIDDFRFENRINSRSEAIRRLIKESLKKYGKKDK
jgi:hypothetical protein